MSWTRMMIKMKKCTCVDMHPDERDAYQEAVHASKAIEWERQQYETVVGSKCKTRESSCPSGAPTMWKSQIT